MSRLSLPTWDAKLDATFFFTKFNYLNFSLIYVYIYCVYVCVYYDIALCVNLETEQKGKKKKENKK